MVPESAVTRLGKRMRERRQTDDDPAKGDIPPAENFLRRALARAVVLGDFLYIDGGMVSQRNVAGSRPVGVNSTLSLDLSTPWKSESAALVTITKPAPLANQQSFWVDTFDRSFYLWGGQTSIGDPPDRNTMWKFSANSKGRGGWTEIQPSNLQTFEDLTRVSNSGVASAEPGQQRAGFTIGGTAASLTSSGVEAEELVAVPGMVTYNITFGAFANESTTEFTESGTWIGGSAEFVPGFGADGIVVLLGGLTTGLQPFPSLRSLDGSDYISLQNITIYEPVGKNWFWQTATGPTPRDRTHACTVGVSKGDGDDRTHDIFLYGGTNSVWNQTYDDVFVLSLPGFVWTELEASKAPRSHHACAIGGNRQMISVGGYQDHLPQASAWEDADPFPQGLGVFDMTDSVWKSEFNPNAAAYEQPQAVKDFYSDGGRDKVAWSSNNVKRLFTNPGTVFEPAKESSKMGIIIGTIVGTMAVIIVCLIAMALYYRRGNRRMAFPGNKWPPSWSAFQQSSTNTGSSGTAIRPPTERFELADTQVGAELDSRPVQFELYSPQQQRAGWNPVRESWVSGDTEDGGASTGQFLSPMSPVQTRYRDTP